MDAAPVWLVGCAAHIADLGGDAGQQPLEADLEFLGLDAEAHVLADGGLGLDPGANREDFLAAISRARGETIAYGVAAIELTDEYLGPGKREIVGPLHDLRHGSERVASESPAVEVDSRKRL